MLKKIFKFIYIFIIFCFVNNIYAYEFKYPEYEGEINEIVEEIFLERDMYEDLVGEYEKDVINIYNASQNSYWWPIGSAETTEVNGKMFAKRYPETTNISSPFGERDDPFGGNNFN